MFIVLITTVELKLLEVMVNAMQTSYVRQSQLSLPVKGEETLCPGDYNAEGTSRGVFTYDSERAVPEE